MPRLQGSRRAPLLATSLRNTFLEAFNRNVAADNANTSAVILPGPYDATRSLGSIARRVQADLRRATGRYFPLSQVVASIHALKDCADSDSPRSDGVDSNAATPKPVQILITPTSPPRPSVTGTPSSMSRRRLACNIPVLQSRLVIPPSSSTFLSPASGSPSSPFGARPLFSLSRRSSLSSGESTRCPVTPIEQITHTPLSPPRMPRLPPPPPRNWAQLHAQMYDNDISPLVSPSLPFTPYILNPGNPGKPALKPLRIPVTCSAGDVELRDNHLASSPRSLSPSGLVSSPLGEGSSAPAMFQRRPGPSRNNSASSLTRTALLRASRPLMTRSSSGSDFKRQDVEPERAFSPISPIASGGPPSRALASPFLIRSEEMDTEYFRF